MANGMGGLRALARRAASAAGGVLNALLARRANARRENGLTAAGWVRGIMVAGRRSPVAAAPARVRDGHEPAPVAAAPSGSPVLPA